MNYETFFILYLVFWWFTCIVYKDNLLPNFICEKGERLTASKSKVIVKLGMLLQELSTCFFCMDNWIAFICFGFSVSYYYEDANYLILGILYSAISTHFRK